MGRFDFRTRTGQISAIIQTQPGISIDADAQAYFDRVTAAGGTLSQTERNAVNVLTIELKSAGIWTLMKAIYPMVGASAAACAQNLKSSNFTGTFSTGWTFAPTGVTGNAVNTYMNTNLNDNTSLSLDNLHFSVYLRSNIDGLKCDLGVWNNNNSGVNIYSRYQNNQYTRLHEEDSNVITTTDSRGFRLGVRNNSTTKNIFINNVKTSFTQNSVSLVNANIFLGALNGTSFASGYSDRENSFASIGDGMTDTQASDFYTLVQTFQTSLSRQV